ncbi:MAG: metal ABC transporter permease [Hormoscilla sp. GUM202]|nr:metal ABC transporter permease [Hormoscilla sp. GUM202]
MNLSEWVSLFSLPFMQRAVVGGVLLGILGGILGSFVILRKLSLFGNALGHAAFLGVVMAALLELPPTASLMGFIVASGLAVVYLIDRTDLGSDTILSIVVAGSVALGTIGFSFLKGYRGNLLSALFGDILAISSTDLILLALLLGITVAWLIWTFPEQVLLTLNSDLARVQGIPVQLYRYLFIVLLSGTIALTIRAVGILLVNAFLVIPAATAKLLCHQFVPFLAMAACIGALSGAGGMVVSGSLDLPSGPSIVLVQLVGFLGAACFRRQHS